jgi:DNA-binding transcriptional ArsR family regulator
MLNYQERQARLNLAFRALGDPTRRAIVERLSRAPASVSELAKPLPMSLPAVHQHLQILHAAGLMAWEKKGRVRWCRLEAKRLATAAEWITARRNMWERNLDRPGRIPGCGRRTTKRRRLV